MCFFGFSELRYFVFKSFEEQGLIGPFVKFQLCQSCPSCFFYHKYHIFDKYLTEIFPPKFLGSFSPVPNSFGWFRSKLSKIWPFTFYDFRQWIDP